jgi:hypothetical protein
MGATGGMNVGAAVPQIFQKIIPLCSNKADNDVAQPSIFDVSYVNPPVL